MGKKKSIICDICNNEINGNYIRAKVYNSSYSDDWLSSWLFSNRIYICKNCQIAIKKAVKKSSEINFSVDIENDFHPKLPWDEI